MLPGFNHNVRHQGVLFHVQTEDKGVDNPIVVTQLFVDGNVLATRRQTYDKFKEKMGAKEIILAIMQEQHKEMMRDLIHGKIKAALEYIARHGSPSEANTEPNLVPDSPAQAATQPAQGTASSDPQGHEKTLDELILEFLSSTKKDGSP